MSLNRWVAAEASRRLKLLYSSLGKDSCSFYSALAANEHLVNELRREEGVESRTKYEKAKLENELNRLKIDKQRREIWLLSLGLCLLWHSLRVILFGNVANARCISSFGVSNP